MKRFAALTVCLASAGILLWILLSGDAEPGAVPSDDEPNLADSIPVFEGYDYENLRWGMAIEEVQDAIEARKTPQDGKPKIWSFTKPDGDHSPDMHNQAELRIVAYRETKHSWDSEAYYFRRDHEGDRFALCFIELSFFEPSRGQIEISVAERLPPSTFIPKAANIRYEPLLFNEAPRIYVNEYAGIQTECTAGRYRYSWADDGSALLDVSLMPSQDNVSVADYANVWWEIHVGLVEGALWASGRKNIQRHDEQDYSELYTGADVGISADYTPKPGLELRELYLFKNLNGNRDQSRQLVCVEISAPLHARRDFLDRLEQDYGSLLPGAASVGSEALFSAVRDDLKKEFGIQAKRTTGVVYTERDRIGAALAQGYAGQE